MSARDEDSFDEAMPAGAAEIPSIVKGALTASGGLRPQPARSEPKTPKK